MDIVQGLFLITSIHILAALSPGPDFVLVSQQALLNGKKAGVMCSLGVTLGLVVHIVYSVFGLSIIISNAYPVIWVIKLLGGSYLIYLGVKGFRLDAYFDFQDGIDSERSVSLKKHVGVGFLCNVLNPKASIYFLSIFTVVLSPSMPIYQIGIYGICMMLIQFSWLSIVAILISNPSINKLFKKYGGWLSRILGGVMIIMGVKVITMQIDFEQ